MILQNIGKHLLVTQCHISEDLCLLKQRCYCVFQIVISGKVGKNNLGDIALDDLSLTHGSCPSECDFYLMG